MIGWRENFRISPFSLGVSIPLNHEFQRFTFVFPFPLFVGAIEEEFMRHSMERRGASFVTERCHLLVLKSSKSLKRQDT